MHSQVEADADEMELAEAALMERLRRDGILRRAGSAVQLAPELQMHGAGSVEALDLVLTKLSNDGTIDAELLVAAENDAAGRNRYGDIRLP